jgi:hypothetical protein
MMLSARDGCHSTVAVVSADSSQSMYNFNQCYFGRRGRSKMPDPFSKVVVSVLRFALGCILTVVCLTYCFGV